MGGPGSGGRNSKRKLRDVQCARLDAHELARDGKLKLGARGWLFGTIWFEVTGGPDAQHLVLDFFRKSTGGEPLGSLTAGHCLLLAESTFWRAIPHVHVPRMPPPSARSVCSVGV